LFNKFVWNEYWKNNKNRFEKPIMDFVVDGKTKELCPLLCELHSNFCTNNRIKNYIKNDIADALNAFETVHVDNDIETPLQGEKEICDYLLEFSDFEGTGHYEFDHLLSNIAYYSLIITRFSIGVFCPWLFQHQYNMFEEICQEFNIKTAVIPSKKDKKSRWLYYAKITHSLNKFKKENQLTIPELWAFLYDFAPKYILSEKITVQDLPEAKSCYLVGANKGNNGDLEFLEKAVEDTSIASNWQLKDKAEVGDVVLFYLLYPISSIAYKGRVLSKPIADPFFHFYYSSTIGHIEKVNCISLQDLKKDPTLKDMPIVRKNMQGINGTRVDDYYMNSFKRILGVSLPLFNKTKLEKFKVTVKNEIDVEEKLINPLLDRLGIKKEDYTRQFQARMGRKDKVIPDYIIYPRNEGMPGYESCKIVIEAKYLIATENDMISAKGQLISYARRLGAETAVLISSRELYVFQLSSKFKKAFYFTWMDLADTEKFEALKKLLLIK